MKFIYAKHKEYEVIISEGGISVITNPGGSFTPNIEAPQNVSKLSQDEIDSIAKSAVEEWKEFF